MYFILGTDMAFPNPYKSAKANAGTARSSSIPRKLKAVIKFGYTDDMKKALGNKDFDSWIEEVLTHTKVHYKHPSLGTIIEFEVRKRWIL